MPQAKKPATTPSLPGAMSTRTDGGIASKQAQRYIAGMPNYGDGQELMDLQASAPMAKTAPQPNVAPTAMGQPQGQPGVIPIDAPSQRPFEPVTNGAASGPGAGPEALAGTPQAATAGMTNALALLNELGSSTSPQIKSIRNALAAHINVQSGS
jgi:hypothetical protein